MCYNVLRCAVCEARVSSLERVLYSHKGVPLSFKRTCHSAQCVAVCCNKHESDTREFAMKRTPQSFKRDPHSLTRAFHSAHGKRNENSPTCSQTSSICSQMRPTFARKSSIFSEKSPIFSQKSTVFSPKRAFDSSLNKRSARNAKILIYALSKSSIVVRKGMPHIRLKEPCTRSTRA